MTYTPQVGDRVRVTYVGTVTFAHGRHFNVGSAMHTTHDVTHVEKIEPPVERFGPGDVVRRRGERAGAYSILLTKDGYSYLNGEFRTYSDGPRIGDLRRGLKSRSGFTSVHYERVEVA